jgi:hypothetical protein
MRLPRTDNLIGVLMIDLLARAHEARWMTRSNLFSRTEAIPFDRPNTDSRGFARRERNARCEDGEQRDVLFTHPRWTPTGSVSGDFAVRLPARPVLAIELGYLAGAVGSDGVRYEIFVIAPNPVTRRTETTQVLRLDKAYTRRWVNTMVDLSFWSGQEVIVRVHVSAGPTSGQDWAAWSVLRIDENAVRANAARWRFSPQTLTVEDRNERSGGGDDPMLAAMYFRSLFGKPGSTFTAVRDRLTVLQDNVDENVPIAITDADRLVVEDMISAEHNGIEGYSIGAFEEDQNGTDTIRSTFADVRIRLTRALAVNVEGDPDAFLDPDTLVGGLEAAIAGSDLGGQTRPFLKWIARAHDYIGLNGAIFISGAIAPLFSGSPAATERPSAPLANRDFSLLFSGSDARYRVTLNARGL